MKLRFFPCLMAIMVAGSLLGAATPVRAVETSRLGAYPTHPDAANPLSKSWFVYSLGAGQSKQDSVTLVNYVDEPITVKVYAVDATTTKDGSFALLNQTDPLSQVGQWVDVQESQVTLEPRARREIPFTIAIPDKATVGDHAGGIVFEETKPQRANRNGMQVNVISRIGVRIYETVPGAQQMRLAVSQFGQYQKDGHLAFGFTVDNQGNTFAQPSGHLKIVESLRRTEVSMPLTNLGTIAPGKPLTKELVSEIPAPVLGYYSAELRLDYGTGRAVSRQLQFWVVDWRVVALVALLPLAFVIGGVWLWRRRTGGAGSPQLAQATTATAVPESAVDSRWLSRAGSGKRRQHAPALPAQVEDGGLESIQCILPEDVDRVFVSRHIKFAMVGLMVLLVLASGGVAWFLRQYAIVSRVTIAASSQDVPPTIEPTVAAATPSASPVATPPAPTVSPTIEAATLHVRVLNGSRRAGAATAAARILQQAGVKIDSVGNADRQTYTTSTLQFPADQQEGAKFILEALAPTYSSVALEPATVGSFTLTLGAE